MLAITAALEADHIEVRLDLSYSIPASPSINPDISLLTLVMPKFLFRHVDSLSATLLVSILELHMKAKSSCKLLGGRCWGRAFGRFSW